MGRRIDQYGVGIHLRDYLNPSSLHSNNSSILVLSFLRNRYWYKAVFAVVNCLGKYPCSMPCTKKATAHDMAWMYTDYIYQKISPKPSACHCRKRDLILSLNICWRWSNFINKHAVHILALRT